MKLIQLVAEALREKPENVSDATSRTTHRRWDSFTHVQLMASIEDTFGVQFSNTEIETLGSVGDVRASLRAKGVAS